MHAVHDLVSFLLTLNFSNLQQQCVIMDFWQFRHLLSAAEYYAWHRVQLLIISDIHERLLV